MALQGRNGVLMRCCAPLTKGEETMSASVMVALAFCAGAVVTDLLWRRIPNRLTLLAAICGLLVHGVVHGHPLDSLAGAAVGFAVLLGPYLLWGIGGGDLKLLTVVGFALGVERVLTASLMMALAGGLLAILVKGNVFGLGSLLGRPWKPTESVTGHEGFAKVIGEPVSIPYGVAIFLGVLAVVLSGGGMRL